MPVVNLHLAPTTEPAERNTAQAIWCCQALWGFAPPMGCRLGLHCRNFGWRHCQHGIRLHIAWVRSQRAPVGMACSGGTGASPEPRFHIRSKRFSAGWRWSGLE